MLNITYEYIDYKNTLFNKVIDFRYDILFKPYGRIQKYTYDEYDKFSLHLIGRINDNIISYSRLSCMDCNGEIGKISNVAVSTQYSNMGIGLYMLNKHIETAKEKNYKYIYLHARIDTVEFYKKAGFEPEGPVFISDKSGLFLQKMILSFN